MKEKDLTRHYRFLMWGGGLILIVVGLGLFLIISFLIGEPLALLYPYINETVLLVIEILGWINIIPGVILFVLGFFARKLARYGIDPHKNELKGPTKTVKYLRIFVICASILLIIAVPIGTFVGIVLIRESWMLKSDQITHTEEKKGIK